MEPVVQLFNERIKERLIAEFFKKITSENALGYLECGTLRERIEKTIGALFFFLICRNIKTDGKLKTVEYLIECEFLREPAPSAKEIAEETFDLLVSKTETGAIRRRRSDATAATGGKVIALSSRRGHILSPQNT